MKFLSLFSLLLSLHSFAGQDKEQMYLMQCGSKKDLEAMAKKMGEKVTEKDLKELKEQRAPILNVLSKGEQGIKELVAEGSRNDVGAFGALAACAIIKDAKARIQKDGCVDLEKNTVVKDNGGIAACDKFLSKLPK